MDRADRLLVTMNLTESDSGMSALELRYSNLTSHADGSASLAFEGAGASLSLGARVKVGAGDQDEPVEIFRGGITGIEVEFGQDAPPELVVFAEDDLQRARMARRTRVHPHLRIADLAQTVARGVGLRAQTEGFDHDVGMQVQLNESDLAFLRRLLRRYDGGLQVVGDTLVVAPRASVDRGRVVLELYSQLQHVRMTADLAHQVTSVSLTAFDPERAEPIHFTSQGSGDLGPGEGRTGRDSLALYLNGDGGRNEHLGHLGTLDQTEARAFAEAAFDQRARRFVVAEGTAEGNPALRVGAQVVLRGISPRFDNTYYVTRACHRFDVRSGYSTDFEAECAYIGEAS